MKLKKLNVKVLLALMVAVTLLGAGGYLIYGVQTRRNASKLLAQADFAEKEKNASRAATILERYLHYRPEDTDALARLGLLQADQVTSTQGSSYEANQAALLVLEQVLGREPGRDDVRRRAIDLSLRLQKFEDAIPHIQDLRRPKHLDDGALELASGRCAEAFGQFQDVDEKELKDQYKKKFKDPKDKDPKDIDPEIDPEDLKGAITQYTEAISHDPTQLEAYVRLSRLLRGESEFQKQSKFVPDAKTAEDADDVMDSLVAKNGQSFEAHLYRAIYRLEHGLEGAAEDITVAEKLKPDSPMVVLVAAQVAEKRSDWDTARQVLKRGLEKIPKDPRLYRALAVVESRAGNLPQAEDSLVRGVQAVPDDRDLKWQLAEIRIERLKGDVDNKRLIKLIDDQIKELGNLNYPKDRIGYLEAHAQFARKKTRENLEKAVLGFEAVLPLLVETPMLVRRAEEMLAQSYAQLAQADPQQSEKYQSQLYQTYQRMAKSDPTDPDIRLRMASFLEGQGRHDEAIEQYRLVIPKQDQPAMAIETNLALARLLIRRNFLLPAARRDWKEVESRLNEVGEKAPDEPRLAIFRADVLAGSDRLDEARALLEKARDANPDRPELWMALIGLAERRGKGEDVPALLDAAEAKLGDRVDLRLIRARNVAIRGGPQVAEKLQALAGSLDKFTPKERGILLRGLAEWHETINRNDRANTLLQQALKESSDDASVQRAYISFQVRQGRKEEAKTNLDNLLEVKDLSPEDEDWAKRVLATLLANDKDQGQANRARELMGLVGADDSGKLALASIPIDRLRIQAQFLAMQSTKGNRGEAIRYLEEVVKRDPNSDEERLTLARLFEIEGNWSEANKWMRQVIDRNPSAPAYRIRYVMALLRNKQADETGPQLDQQLDQLEKAHPETPVIQQFRAMALSEQGKGDEAVALLRGFAQRHMEQSGFAAQVLELIGHVPEAEAVLRRYVAEKQATEPRAVLVLAEFLGRQGRTREALDLCEGAWKTCPPGTVADMCGTILLAADPDETQVRRVEDWVKAELARNPSLTQLQTAMAILRTVEGRYSEAEAIYREAIAKDANDIVALNNLAWLIAIKQEGKAPGALELLNHAIEVVGPGAPLLDTRAVIHMKMGHSDLAIADLETAIASNPIPPMYFHLAQAFLMANRRDDAQAAMKDGQRLGLKPNSLDPLERPAYTEVVDALARN